MQSLHLRCKRQKTKKRSWIESLVDLLEHIVAARLGQMTIAAQHLKIGSRVKTSPSHLNDMIALSWLSTAGPVEVAASLRQPGTHKHLFLKQCSPQTQSAGC